MEKWEYLVWHYNGDFDPTVAEWRTIETGLRVHGEDGWELVAAVSHPHANTELPGVLYHFKRPKTAS
jgi:hypothetical protein